MAKKPTETVEASASTDVAVPMTTSEKALDAIPKNISNSNEIVLPDGRVIKVSKRVTLPQLKQRDGETVMFTVTGKMFVGKEVKSEKKADMAPPHIIHVREIASGAEMQYLVPTVLQRVFDEDYPGDTYVGKSFAVMMIGKADGKRHKDLHIAEIDVA